MVLVDVLRVDSTGDSSRRRTMARDLDRCSFGDYAYGRVFRDTRYGVLSNILLYSDPIPDPVRENATFVRVYI